MPQDLICVTWEIKAKLGHNQCWETLPKFLQSDSSLGVTHIGILFELL